MSNLRKILVAAAITLLSVSGCNYIQDLLHDGDVVAKAGKARLYRSDLNSVIPKGISPADSTNLALQYIKSWAEDQLFCQMASRELSKQDQDVSQELEAYRQALLRFRYEQHFINDRLDTLITEDQMILFYEANQRLFLLERPIVMARFVDIYKTAEQKDKILSKLTSNKAEDVQLLDSLANTYAIRYFDNTQTWMDVADLAKEFDMDYGTMLSTMKQNTILRESKATSDVKAAYIRTIIRSGVAPMEFCTERIQDYILSARKRELLQALEHSLLEEASNKGDFLIY